MIRSESESILRAESSVPVIQDLDLSQNKLTADQFEAALPWSPRWVEAADHGSHGRVMAVSCFTVSQGFINGPGGGDLPIV